MKFESFNLVQDKVSELNLLEIAGEIQDIFFEWSDQYDLYLEISFGTIISGLAEAHAPIWDLIKDVPISNSWTNGVMCESVIKSSTTSPILFIEFGIDENLRWENVKYTKERADNLERIRLDFTKRFRKAFNLEIVSENYHQLSWGWSRIEVGLWASRSNRTAIAFRIALKIP